MKNVRVLITDLDDTVWDWLSMWYSSFHPYFESIKNQFNIDDTILKNDFRELHRRYHTSEVSYAYPELTSLTEEQKNQIELERENEISIIHQYYRNKKNNLKLYDNVEDTLRCIKAKGTRIIGFTESNIFYTKYRIKTLGLDGIFDIIYTPEDHTVPPSTVRYYDDNHWEPKHTSFRKLPNNFTKPNHEILKKILLDNNATISEAIYVGDKLDRDILMCNHIDLTSVHALYGYEIENDKYELLKKVTHWSDNEVQREIEFKNKNKNVKIVANYTISNFSELIKMFNFIDYYKGFEYTNEDKRNIIEIWKNIIEVQKHFNDIEIRIRNFAITVFTFFFAAIGFCIKENIFIQKFGLHFSFSIIVSFIGLIVILALLMMDKYWYHRYLQSAVQQGMSIESTFSDIYPQMTLSNKIKKNSSLNNIFKFIPARINSNLRISLFYWLLLVPYIIVSVLLFTYNKDLSLKSEYNSVKNNSKKIQLDKINEIPNSPGLFLIIDNNGKLISVNETSDLNNYVRSIIKNNSSILKGHIAYYAVANIARKELEEYIMKEGIKFAN